MQKRWLIGFLAFNLTLATLAGASIGHYGSIRQAVEVWDGRVIQPDHQTKVLQFGTLDGPGEVTFQIKNYGGQTVRVVGGHVGCRARMIAGPPFSLAPGGSHTICFLVRKDSTGLKEEAPFEAEFFTNLAEQRSFSLCIQCSSQED